MPINNSGRNNDPTNALRALHAAQSGQAAFEKAKKEGMGGHAIDYWDGAAKNATKDVEAGKSWWITGQAKFAGAKVMGFFAKLSGLDGLEGRLAQNKTLWAEGGASTGEKIKAGAWLTFEGVFFALNFTGLGGMAKGILRRQATKFVAKEGAEIAAKYGVRVAEQKLVGAGLGKAIKGMLPATPEAAALVRKELAAVIAKLPTAGKYGAAELKGLQEGLVAVGKKYGVEVAFKAGPPQVLTEAGKITVTGLGTAAWHEMIHVVQTVQTQATAMASIAQRVGKPVSQLTKAHLGEAYTATVKTLETQGYKHFEEQAFKGVGAWGQTLNPARYTKVLTEGLGQFERALVTGTAPNVAPGLGAKIYGLLTALGQTQTEIVLNLTPVYSGTRWLYRTLSEPN